MTSWAEDKFVGSEESMMRVVGSSPLTPAPESGKGSDSIPGFSFDELPSRMELRDAIIGGPYMETE